MGSRLAIAGRRLALWGGMLHAGLMAHCATMPGRVILLPSFDRSAVSSRNNASVFETEPALQVPIAFELSEDSQPEAKFAEVKTDGFHLTFAEQQWKSVAEISLIVLQATLIAVLLWQLMRRRHSQQSREEMELRESEARLELAAKATKFALWEWDIARDEIRSSRNGRELFGLAWAERIDFNRFLGTVHADDREGVSHAVAKSFNGDGDFESEYRLAVPGQPMRWIATCGRVEFDPAGKPVLMHGISFDITERKQTEEALQESEARFRTVANTAPVMIWMAGTDKLCNFFNNGWLNFTGRPLEQEFGNGWTEGVHPEDFDRCLKIYTDSFDARRKFAMEYRLRRHDGEHRWVLDTGVPRFAPDGAFLGYIGSAIDITEQKQAEERFRLVVEASPNAMIMVNSGGAIALVNAQAEKVFGYTRAELVGQSIETLVPEIWRGQHPAHRQSYFAALSARAMGVGRELFGRRKDGSEVAVEIGLTPIRTPEGPFVLASVIDVTERKQAELEIQHQRAELAHVARVSTMGELAASVAHELNQPLGAILSNADAAEMFLNMDPPVLEEVREILEDIRDDDQRAGEIIHRMRTLLRKHEMELEPLGINSLVEDVFRLVSTDAALRRTVIRAELSPNLPLIRGDRIHLQQVMLNLILNGMDAMATCPAESRKLVVRTGRNEEGFVEVAITDAGQGIAAALMPRLFEPFLTTKSTGMGMGLSIARRIVEAHKGRIWAQNNTAGGATIRFTLPVDINR
jgi:two-component system sensor kinase FixL